MKLLYLAEWDAFSNSGVMRKIKAQFETWQHMGIDARLVIVSPSPQGDTKPLIQDDGITIFSHRAGRFGLGKVFKALALRAAIKMIQEYSPNVIYYRQSSWTPGILGLLESAPCVVVEVNSNDVFEVHQYGWLKARYHLATRDWLIRRVTGFVCVGKALGAFYEQYGKPVAVIGNGFDTGSVVPRESTGNKRPQLAFVGSAGQAWHGVDKILEMAKALPQFDFHIIGDTLRDAPINVISHGHLVWKELDQLYQQMDVGIASLALHRIGVDEISPLKTREYLAYGLPVIAAYEDPDLNDCPFFLELPNSEEGIRISYTEIVDFVMRWKDKKIDMDWVRQRIDSEVKERNRISFLLEMGRSMGVVPVAAEK